MSNVLVILERNLSHIDGQFVVGCMNDDARETKCKVTVRVAARNSATDNQKVMCAYGKDSNPLHQPMTLSRSQNSFTLDKIPENDAKMMLQCQRKVEGNTTKKVKSDALESSVCSVDVTIEGAGPPWAGMETDRTMIQRLSRWIHGSATAVHRNIQRKPSSAIRTILLTVALIVVAAVSSHYQSSPAFLALAAQQKSGCTTAGGRTRCTCESDAEPVDLISTSISEDANEFEMQCNTGMKFEPRGLKNSFACPAGTGELEECKCDEKPDQPHCLDIETLLYGAPNSLQRTDGQAKGKEGPSKVLSIQRANFLYLDE
ncbi:SAG-related sequence [Besnoitia besnoiti]|uniref:SAG-related sequence n=1 Tax=Besnoitia besnoiti TaxID=94643 RepID=A0A2A9MMM6_BESBE|nr:SAG-related sequence [Besnoitia besnoiti]PFH36802.1 SAG-related sequence [Besnoitia besnoiti]